MTYDLKIGYQSLPLVTSRTLFFSRSFRQLGAKREVMGRTNPARRPRYEKALAWRGLTTKFPGQRHGLRTRGTTHELWTQLTGQEHLHISRLGRGRGG